MTLLSHIIAGVIAAVSDFSIPIDRVVGTSSGALAAALFADGYDSFEIATGEILRDEFPLLFCSDPCG